MIPRLDISFPFHRQWQYWCGRPYEAQSGEYLLNHARSGIVLALQTALPNGGRVGVVAYNCHTVANAVVHAGCAPVFVDVTNQLTIDTSSLPADLDALVVTNLLGIRNDISIIRQRCPHAVIIVDNAHGYGLPVEGDFSVYSINQGKFPSLGEGGLLYVNNSAYHDALDKAYSALPVYGFAAQLRLFVKILCKAAAYMPCLYDLTRRYKREHTVHPNQSVRARKMAPNISRLYRAALPKIPQQIAMQQHNAQLLKAALLTDPSVHEVLIGENAFMVVAYCDDPQALAAKFAGQGVETATHFRHAIDWARSFGYQAGSCLTAEQLTQHLLMIPTYKSINQKSI